MLICNHQHDFFGRKTATLISYTGVVLAEHPEWTGFLCYTLQNFNEGHGEDFLLHKKLLLWWTSSTLHSQYLGVFSGSLSLHWNEEICTEKHEHGISWGFIMPNTGLKNKVCPSHFSNEKHPKCLQWRMLLTSKLSPLLCASICSDLGQDSVGSVKQAKVLLRMIKF